ncbi:MAG: cyclic nucleotide-binding domain-containing protein, partial [Leptospirales bacterium]
SGNVKVVGMEQGEVSEEAKQKRFGNYEYFGEASLINNQPRSADVVAETDVVALTIGKSRFLNFIKGSDLQKNLAMLHDVRKTGTWDVLTVSRFFKDGTSAQKTQLELLMEITEFSAGTDLVSQGQHYEYAYIIKSGMVEAVRDGQVVEHLSRGDFCGEIYQLQKDAPSTIEFKAATDVEAYRLERSALMEYIDNNPGVYMRLNYIYGNQ